MANSLQLEFHQVGASVKVTSSLLIDALKIISPVGAVKSLETGANGKMCPYMVEVQTQDGSKLFGFMPHELVAA